jgi:hypothetical protein
MGVWESLGNGGEFVNAGEVAVLTKILVKIMMEA